MGRAGWGTLRDATGTGCGGTPTATEWEGRAAFPGRWIANFVVRGS